jgi:hypothetical protein
LLGEPGIEGSAQRILSAKRDAAGTTSRLGPQRRFGEMMGERFTKDRNNGYSRYSASAPG